jgi:hypothetical protein
MKQPIALAALPLISFLATAGPLDRPYEPAGAYPSYWNDAVVPPLGVDLYPGAPLAEHGIGAREGGAPRWREPPPWVSVPAPAAGGPRGEGYLPPGSGAAEPGLYERLTAPYDAGASPWAGSPPLPAGGGERYRFRGDAPPSSGSWSGYPGQGQFRFRPLSEQERERLYGELPWRPMAPTGALPGPPAYPEQRREPPAPVPGEEAYGYEPDNWFRRYYGERP